MTNTQTACDTPREPATRRALWTQPGDLTGVCEKALLRMRRQAGNQLWTDATLGYTCAARTPLHYYYYYFYDYYDYCAALIHVDRLPSVEDSHDAVAHGQAKARPGLINSTASIYPHTLII